MRFIEVTISHEKIPLLFLSKNINYALNVLIFNAYEKFIIQKRLLVPIHREIQMNIPYDLKKTIIYI
jgi:hypothetical protein